MHIRFAELLIRSMCFCGRNSRTCPSRPRNALSPSKTDCA